MMTTPIAQKRPDKAMVLAAGLGTRMRAVSRTIPKPLVQLRGKCLVDYVLDRLKDAGVTTAVINTHYQADMIERHLSGRRDPRIIWSDERAGLLNTGGGVKKALPLLGDAPFIIHNSDSVWTEGRVRNLERLADGWDDARMDCLLLLADAASSIGYSGAGDFALEDGGTVRRRREGESVPFVYTGVCMAHPRLFDVSPDGAFSMNVLWTRAIEEGRLFGVAHKGVWMHVGTPQALDEAGQCLAGAAE